MKYLSPERRKQLADDEVTDKIYGLYINSLPPTLETPIEPVVASPQEIFEEVTKSLTTFCEDINTDDMKRFVSNGASDSFQKAGRGIAGTANFNATARRANLAELIKKACQRPQALQSHEMQLVQRIHNHLGEAMANMGNRVNSSFIDRASDYFVDHKKGPGVVPFSVRLTQDFRKSVLFQAMENEVWSNSGYMLDYVHVSNFDEDETAVPFLKPSQNE